MTPTAAAGEPGREGGTPINAALNSAAYGTKQGSSKTKEAE